MSRYDLTVNQATVLHGDCLTRLAALPDQSVQTCVTSPPYFGLRDYGINGQIGLEATAEQYIENLVAVFREVRRVLADDGVLWLNLGDTYSKNKQIMGIPWRVALALQADGWCLRQDIVWHKTNAMPESVKDRCTRAHEYIFLLTKSERYFFDHQAMKEPVANAPSGPVTRNNANNFKRANSKRAQVIPNQQVGTHRADREESSYDLMIRNKRSVWSVATRPHAGAHFAVYPPQLIEPCVLAGSREGDTVLDPFNGSGTTGEVALLNNRHYIGIELNPTYIKLTQSRLEQVVVELEERQIPDPQIDLFENNALEMESL